jgi:hypothetical protein
MLAFSLHFSLRHKILICCGLISVCRKRENLSEKFKYATKIFGHFGCLEGMKGWLDGRTGQIMVPLKTGAIQWRKHADQNLPADRG